jgi:hypothetical protein
LSIDIDFWTHVNAGRDTLKIETTVDLVKHDFEEITAHESFEVLDSSIPRNIENIPRDVRDKFGIVPPESAGLPSDMSDEEKPPFVVTKLPNFDVSSVGRSTSSPVGGTDDSDIDQLEIIGYPETEGSTFELEVDNSITIVSGDATISDSGRTARGRVSGGESIEFEFSGDITMTEFGTPKNAKIAVNGYEFPIGRKSVGEKTDLTNTIVIEGSGKSGSTDYSVTVSDALEYVDGELEGYSVTKDPSDTVSDSTAEGSVSSGNDGLRFAGELESIELSNPVAADVYVNGELWQSVIEDFEDQDLSEYDGDLENATTQTDTTTQGSAALDIEGGNEIVSLDGLDAYPEPGDVFEAHHNVTEESVARFGWGAQGNEDLYYVEVAAGENRYSLFKRVGGRATELDSISVPVPTDEWLRSEIEWYSDGRMTARLFGDTDPPDAGGPGPLEADSDEPITDRALSATDTTFESGGIMWGDGGSSSPEVIEDFEDGDVEEYVGGTDPATVQSNVVAEGNNALSIPTDEEIVSTEGLETYPEQGDIFEARHRLEDADSARFGWGVQDRENLYYLAIDAANGSLNVHKRDGDSDSVLTSSEATVPTDTWLRSEVAWYPGGSMTVSLYDDAGAQLGRVDVSDDTWTDGGIMWGAGTGTPQSPDGLIEDFEDGDVDEYVGETETVSVQTDVAFEGDNSLVSPPNTEIVSTNGLDTYPERGDVFEARHRIEEGSIARFGFGTQDGSNTYLVEIDESSEVLRLVKREGGSRSELASESATIPVDEWLRSEVEWRDDGAITVELFDGSDVELTGGVTATNRTWESGGILWGGDEGRTRADEPAGSATATFSGSIQHGGAATHTYRPQTIAPDEITISLSGPVGTDFDLYCTLDGRTPTEDDFDERSWNYGSDEEIVVEADEIDSDTGIGILVKSYRGGGEYALTVQED